MEEHILTVLENNETSFDDGYGDIIYGVANDSYKDVSKEITAHIMQFIHWANHAETQYDLGRWPMSGENNDEFAKYTDEELYQYWIENVYNK